MIQNQGWAVGLLKQIRVPMRTCEAVLTANSDSENRGGLRTRPTRAPKDHTPSDVANIEEWNYWMGSPLAFWSGRRKVLTSSPSTHTIIPENRLNHPPSGTSGLLSSHVANKTSCSAEIFRSCMRFNRCWKRAGGTLVHRTLGTG